MQLGSHRHLKYSSHYIRSLGYMFYVLNLYIMAMAINYYYYRSDDIKVNYLFPPHSAFL